MSARIAFFSPREFGQQGTPGTYRIIKEVSRYHEVRVFSQPPSDRSVYWSRDIPIIPLQGPLSEHVINSVRPVLQDFDADLVYVFNAANWGPTVKLVKEIFPDAKIILDIKTPLLTDSEEQSNSIRIKGQEASDLLDSILTPAVQNVESWIPNYAGSVEILPLGVDLSKFSSNVLNDMEDSKTCQQPAQLIYASSIDWKRKASELIEGFRIFLSKYPKSAVLNIYGEGTDRAKLEAQAAETGISDWVKFHGLVPQSELFNAMEKMDCAIGWVPKELYDTSPSLKVLEYVAAGLPVLATSTSAHKDMQSDGFSLDYFSDSPESLAIGLSRWFEEGFSKDRIMQNLEAVRERDYSRLVRHRLLPIINRLLGEPKNALDYQFFESKFESLAQGGARSDEKCWRLIFIYNEELKGGMLLEDILSIAGMLSNRGCKVYFAYRCRASRSFLVDDKVILYPYQDFKTLKNLVEGGRFDAMATFSLGIDSTVQCAALAKHYSLRMILDSLCFEERVNNLSGQARANWMKELVKSACGQGLISIYNMSIEDLSYYLYDITDSELGFNGLLEELGEESWKSDRERVLHRRRVLKRVLGD